MKKGQYIRLLIKKSTDSGDKLCVMAATNMTLHISATVENSTTKDDEGDFDVQEVTGLNYDITSDALVVVDATDTGARGLDWFMDSVDGSELYWTISEVAGDEGEKNRDATNDICQGTVKATSLSVNAPNRQNSTLSASFGGYGAISISE